MRTVDRIRDLLSPGLQDVHKARVGQIFAMVAGLVRGGQATLTAIGRAVATATTDKHGIKRADRCIGNAHLHRETPLFWRALASTVLVTNRRPWILVDWTDVGSGFAALRAAVVLQGRALCIFSQVYRTQRAGNSSVQGRFLKSFKDILPAECRPIIVSDCGFQGTWFEQVRSLGWDFLGRLHPQVTLRSTLGGPRLKVSTLQRKATNLYRDCGQFELTQRHRYIGRVVSFDGRSPRARASRAPKRRKRAQNKGAKRAHSPLVLVTSAHDISAKSVVNIYKTRMQIEETFRDDKSPRYGWQFEFARSRNPRRLQVLLLLIALATLAVALAGLATLANNEQGQYQANTRRHRAVLSIISLGRRVLDRLKDLSPQRIALGLRELRATILAAHLP